jgi:Glycosyltransferase family 87
MSRLVRVALALSIALTIGQAVSLYGRGRGGQSDFGVFYRTSLLLKTGIGAELFPRNDPVAGWPIALSPTGLSILQPLTAFGPGGASAVWGILNLAFVGVALIGLRNFLKRVGPPLAATYLWAVCIFLALAAGSIQVGQFSVLIVACWILWLNALVAKREFRSGILLAMASTLKLYPVMLLAVPFSTTRSLKSAGRHALFLVLGLVIAGLLLPAVAYGRRAWELDVSFLEHTVFTSSSAGPVGYALSLRTFANQSLDTVLLRYGSYDPQFHDQYTYVPHLRFARPTVLAAAMAVRLLVLLVAGLTVFRWHRIHHRFGAHEIMMAAALWCSTLYLLLPDTKWRYAIYTMLAFLPMLEATAVARTRSLRLARVAELAICLVLIVAELPVPLQAFGIGFLGALVLWAENVRLMVADSSQTGYSGAESAPSAG